MYVCMYAYLIKRREAHADSFHLVQLPAHCARLHEYAHIYMNTYMSACMCVCMYVCMYVQLMRSIR